MPAGFSLSGPSPIASAPAPFAASSQSSGSPVGTMAKVTLYAAEPEIRPKPIPIFWGTPLGRQSPYSVYKFPLAAQVGIHESQPWVEAICVICDLASQVMGPTTAAVPAASDSGVWSTVPLQAPELPTRIQSRLGSAEPSQGNKDFGIDL